METIVLVLHDAYVHTNSTYRFVLAVVKGGVGGCRVGAALLRGEYEEAVRLIMQPRDGEREETVEARRLYLDKGKSACSHD